MSSVREVACYLIKRYKLECQNRYRIGRLYTAAKEITDVIGSFTSGVVTAEYYCSSGSKSYIEGTLTYHALAYHGGYVVGSMYPLDDSKGQTFVNNPYNYTPTIGDFTSTVPVEAILYRLCNCRVYGVYLKKDETITRKYKYKSCKMTIYTTELVFPDGSGQATVGGLTGTEYWRVY